MTNSDAHDFIRNHTTADCTFASDRTVCVNPDHRCCDCATHTLPTYNAARESIDHDCPSPSSNY